MFNKITHQNTKNSLEEIVSKSSYLTEKIKKNEITIVSGFYDTATGLVSFD